MQRWMIGGLVGACVGVGVYLLVAGPPVPAPASATGQSPAIVDPPAPPSVAVALAEVVDVTDLDALLDPPAKPVTGAPFDDAATVPVSAPAAPQLIPHAVD